MSSLWWRRRNAASKFCSCIYINAAMWIKVTFSTSIPAATFESVSLTIFDLNFTKKPNLDSVAVEFHATFFQVSPCIQRKFAQQSTVQEMQRKFHPKQPRTFAARCNSDTYKHLAAAWHPVSKTKLYYTIIMKPTKLEHTVSYFRYVEALPYF